MSVSSCDEAGSRVFVDKFYGFKWSSHSVLVRYSGSNVRRFAIEETKSLGSVSSVIPIELLYETLDPYRGTSRI